MPLGTKFLRLINHEIKNIKEEKKKLKAREDAGSGH